MQNQNWASGGAQGYRGQARRPVTIAAPHDQQSTYQGSAQGGGRGRRYSTMKSRVQVQPEACASGLFAFAWSVRSNFTAPWLAP